MRFHCTHFTSIAKLNNHYITTSAPQQQSIWHQFSTISVDSGNLCILQHTLQATEAKRERECSDVQETEARSSTIQWPTIISTTVTQEQCDTCLPEFYYCSMAVWLLLLLSFRSLQYCWVSFAPKWHAVRYRQLAQSYQRLSICSKIIGITTVFPSFWCRHMERSASATPCHICTLTRGFQTVS